MGILYLCASSSGPLARIMVSYGSLGGSGIAALVTWSLLTLRLSTTARWNNHEVSALPSHGTARTRDTRTCAASSRFATGKTVPC